ncbi:MAG TPA: transposase, partial [Myxococcota bacterium]|nr:transposase [Myxococcota bacterium]
GYRQLAEVERAWRSLKSELDIRPMYHRLDDRIRAHVLLCWLALLLVRVAEVKTGESWDRLRTELDRLHCVTLEGDAGQVAQRTELTDQQKQIYVKLGVAPPPKFMKLDVVSSRM